MLEPYDPDRIPVILIHGLTSIPQMWVFAKLKREQGKSLVEAALEGAKL
jgi:hypothetical protein